MPFLVADSQQRELLHGLTLLPEPRERQQKKPDYRRSNARPRCVTREPPPGRMLAIMPMRSYVCKSGHATRCAVHLPQFLRLASLMGLQHLAKRTTRNLGNRPRSLLHPSLRSSPRSRFLHIPVRRRDPYYLPGSQKMVDEPVIPK